MLDSEKETAGEVSRPEQVITERKLASEKPHQHIATNSDLELTGPKERITEPERTITKSRRVVKSHSDSDAFIIVGSSSESEDGSSLPLQEHTSKVTM